MINRYKRDYYLVMIFFKLVTVFLNQHKDSIENTVC